MFNIYLVINKINDKKYVGITRHPIKKRWREHLSASKAGSKYKFHKAIRKYGNDNFIVNVIETVNNETDLLTKEIAYIEKYNSFKCGYNNTLGGEGSHQLTIKELNRYKKTFLETKSLTKTAKVYGKSPAMMGIHLQRVGVNSGMFVNNITDNKIEYALHYLNNGFELKEIAKKLKTNATYIGKKVKDKYGITSFDIKKKAKLNKTLKGLEMYEKTNLNAPEIAKIVNLSYSTFRRELLKNNVLLKRKYVIYD
jgi:group I intron endonuclease